MCDCVILDNDSVGALRTEPRIDVSRLHYGLA
jgi:hypothetical protein